MSNKTPLPPVLDELLNSLGGPPTDEYRAEIEQAAKAILHNERLRGKNREPRGSRQPLLDDWLDARLAERPYTNDQLFNLVPEDGDKLYRDGEMVGIDGKKNLLGRSGFDKRVTEARKRIAKPR